MLVPGDETEAQRLRDETAGVLELDASDEEMEARLGKAVASLNVATRLERTATGHLSIVVVDKDAREMSISPELVRRLPMDKLHAMIAAFAIGAAEIKFWNGDTLHLVVEPKAEESESETAIPGG